MSDSKINSSTNHIILKNPEKSTSYLSGITKRFGKLGNMGKSAPGALRGIISGLGASAIGTKKYISNKLDAFKGSVEKIDYYTALEKTDIQNFTGNDYEEKYDSIKIMGKDDVEKANRDRQTLCVSSGMGGHAGAFVNVMINKNTYCGKIINPGDTTELEFYKFMNDNADKPFYGTFNQFIPQLHGIVAVKNNTNINKFFGLRYKYYYCIALDNMKKGIEKPVFIDIKIGAYTAKNAGIKKEALHKIINDKQSFSRAVGSRVEGYSSPNNLKRDRRPDITPGRAYGSYISRQNIFQEKYIKKFEDFTGLEGKIKGVFTFLKKQKLEFMNNYIKSFLFETAQEKSVLSTHIHLPNKKTTFKDRIKRANPFLLLNISLEDIYPQDNDIDKNIKSKKQKLINDKKMTNKQIKETEYNLGKLDADNSIKIKILNDIELGLFNIINDYILPNYNSFINGGACFSFTGSSVGIIFTGKATGVSDAKAIVKLFDFGHPETYGTGFSGDKSNNKRNIMGWAINDYSYGIINLYIMVYFNLLIYNKKEILEKYEEHIKNNEPLKNTYNSYFDKINNPKIEVLYRLILKPMADQINDNSFIRFKKVLNILLYMNTTDSNYPSKVEQIYKQNYSLNNLRKYNNKAVKNISVKNNKNNKNNNLVKKN